MANPIIAHDMRVMASEVPDVGESYGTAFDIGAAGEVFGDRLSAISTGNELGEDAQLGAYNRWPLIEGDRIIGEIRDDATGLTVHVDRINGHLVSVAGETMMTSDLNNRPLSSIVLEFFAEYERKNVIFCDAGNGCGFGESGQTVEYDAATMADLMMTDIPDGEDRKSNDGFDSITQSEWQHGENGYRWRIRF